MIGLNSTRPGPWHDCALRTAPSRVPAYPQAGLRVLLLPGTVGSSCWGSTAILSLALPREHPEQTQEMRHPPAGRAPAASSTCTQQLGTGAASGGAVAPPFPRVHISSSVPAVLILMLFTSSKSSGFPQLCWRRHFYLCPHATFTPRSNISAHDLCLMSRSVFPEHALRFGFRSAPSYRCCTVCGRGALPSDSSSCWMCHLLARLLWLSSGKVQLTVCVSPPGVGYSSSSLALHCTV